MKKYKLIIFILLGLSFGLFLKINQVKAYSLISQTDNSTPLITTANSIYGVTFYLPQDTAASTTISISLGTSNGYSQGCGSTYDLGYAGLFSINSNYPTPATLIDNPNGTTVYIYRCETINGQIQSITSPNPLQKGWYLMEYVVNDATQSNSSANLEGTSTQIANINGWNSSDNGNTWTELTGSPYLTVDAAPPNISWHYPNSTTTTNIPIDLNNFSFDFSNLIPNHNYSLIVSSSSDYGVILGLPIVNINALSSTTLTNIAYPITGLNSATNYTENAYLFDTSGNLGNSITLPELSSSTLSFTSSGYPAAIGFNDYNHLLTGENLVFPISPNVSIPFLLDNPSEINYPIYYFTYYNPDSYVLNNCVSETSFYVLYAARGQTQDAINQLDAKCSNFLSLIITSITPNTTSSAYWFSLPQNIPYAGQYIIYAYNVNPDGSDYGTQTPIGTAVPDLINFLFPTNNTTTPMFDNWLLSYNGIHNTYNDKLTAEVDWSINGQSYHNSITGTGENFYLHGILIPREPNFLSLNPNTYSVSATAKIFDSNGNLLAQNQFPLKFTLDLTQSTANYLSINTGADYSPSTNSIDVYTKVNITNQNLFATSTCIAPSGITDVGGGIGYGGCLLTNYAWNLLNNIAINLSNIAASVFSLFKTIFPFSAIYSFNNDIQIIEATTSPIILSVGNGVLFNGHIFNNLLTTSTIKNFSNNTGFDIFNFESKIIWAFTGIATIFTAIIGISILHGGGDNNNNKK